MPGLIGFALTEPQRDRPPLLAEMARRLESENRYRRDLYEDGCLGLGRISLGIINPEPQPFWNEDRSIAVVMEGEFYNADAECSTLSARGVVLRNCGDAELALRLYEAYGDEFAARMMGAFVIAVWDRNRSKLLITNDRLGLYPLYYTQTSAGLFFASGVRSLMAEPSVLRRVDHLAIAEFLTFDHMLDDHTLLDAVKLLPQAAVLNFSEGEFRLGSYWQPKYASRFPLRNENDYVEQLRGLLERAVKRQTTDRLTKGILLSGGVDSRVILGFLAQDMSVAQIKTLTWGVPGCDDARAAAETARAIGAPHTFIELKPDWLLHLADEAVRITDGQGNICNLHALASAEACGREAQVIYKGFMGDAMMGFALRRRFFADYSPEDKVEAHWQTYRDQGVITFDAHERPAFFTSEFGEQVGDGVQAALRDGMLRSGVDHMTGQRLFFDMAQRVPRMTINGVEVVRSHVVVRLPFSDYDLWDFTLDLPPGYMFERYLYNRTFAETFPKLAKIPIAQTGLPMISCARDVWARGLKLAQWHLRSIGMQRLAGPVARPYKDYHSWFRTVLRDWMQDILLSPASLDRGYFRPEKVKELVSQHLAGVNQTTRLGALLTLELWHRQFID